MSGSRVVLSTLITLALSASSLGQKPELNADRETAEFRATLDQIMPEVLRDYRMPGAAVVLIKDGKTAWIAGYGYADISTQRPITANTVFNLGSISKMVAAWGVMKLVQDGKLDLDAPVGKYLTRWRLPETKFDNAGVSMRRLLSHTGGLNLPSVRAFDDFKDLPTIEQSLSDDVRVVVEPGTKWSYSGGGYTLAQLVVEEVSRISFSEFMEREIFRPLGMTHSAYGWPERIKKNAATPYDRYGQTVSGPYFTALAAAGLQTTPRDMARFVEAWMRPKVLSEETIQLIRQPANDASPEYGLGCHLSKLAPFLTMVGHGGSNRGWSASVVMVPESGDGLLVMTNSSLGRYVRELVRCHWRNRLTGNNRVCRKAIHPIVLATTLDKGADAAVARYRALRRNEFDVYDFGVAQLNAAGVDLVRAGRMADAIALLKINVEMFPRESRPLNFLGQAYMRGGEINRAIECFEKSLELNQDNLEVAALLKQLREQKASDRR